MKEFKCYYIADGEMQNENIYAKTEKNARDRMRRRGIQCKAILEQREIKIDEVALYSSLIQCGYQEAETDFICDLVKRNV